MHSIAADREQAVARHGQLQDDQDEPEHDEEQAADVQRQAPEAR